MSDDPVSVVSHELEDASSDFEAEFGDSDQGSGSISSNLDDALRAARPTPTFTPSESLEGRALAGGRIRVGRRIGGGATSIVYEATDGGHTVAIKVLHRLQELQVYRLKTEFRRLSELNHPNVVGVYELFNEDGEWFFSMERVHGLRLNHYLEARLLTDEDGYEAELRSLLKQLIEGIAAVHEQGLVHRDIKPANILVDDGRLVIVDFGLVSEQHAGGVGQTVDFRVSGTHGYMAPEQLLGELATTASDRYSLGATLYHVLNGHAPNTARPVRVGVEPLFERTFARASQRVQRDLTDLWQRLLSPDPEQRPSMQALLQLCRDWPAPALSRSRTARKEPVSFVGREAELAALREAYVAARAGEQPALLIRGVNGVGKTALLREFVTRLTSEGVVLLKGRCSEWESVPYKGLDEVIDQLSRLLLRMPDEQSGQLVPRNARAVARVFPTLLRVATFRDAAQNASPDQNEESLLRQRAVSGLKDMFYRLAERHEIALVIDDLQWVDADTVQLLVEMLAPPDTPRLFLLASRTDGARADEFFDALSQVVKVKTLALGPLDEKASRDLMQSMAASAARPFESEFVERVVRESEGMPLYISELAEFSVASPGQHATPQLAHMLLTRIERLNEGARRLLELVAVAVRPLSLLVAGECGIDDVRESLRQLTSERLLRSSALPNGELGFEPYTEPLRQVVLQAMPEPQLKQAHIALVHALNSLPDIEPQWILAHYRGAGLYEQAKQYSVIMAEHSLGVLAFEHAASMYRAALELTREDSPDFAELNLKYAEALAKAGRGAESAEAYIRAAQGDPPERSFALLNAAVTQWIRAGHIGEGVQSLRKTLKLVGVAWPETSAAAVVRLLRQRLTIRLRGLDCTLRSEHEAPPNLLRKLDALNPAQTALGSFDYLRGAMFAAIALPLALEAGEPKRLIVALASEAIYTSLVEGLSGERRVFELQRRIDELRQHASGPYERAASLMVRAVSAYWMGLWKDVLVPAERAEELLQRDVAGAVWERTLLRSVRHTVLLHAGGLREIGEELPEALRHAASRDDQYSYLDLLRRSVVTHLARNDIATASSTIEQLLELRSRYPFLALDHLLMTSVVATHLYAGDLERANHELSTRWAACRKGGAARLPLVRLTVLGMQGACVQACKSLSLAQRERELRQLARAAGNEKVGWSEALKHALLADAEECGGKYAQAQVELRMCADLFDLAGLSMAGMAARFRSMQLLERRGIDSERSGLRHAGYEAHPERVAEYFTQLGVANPSSWVRVVHALY